MAAEAPADGTLRRRPSRRAAWQARAFGVDFELHFEAPALRQGKLAWGNAHEPTILELVYASSLDGYWRPEEAQHLGGMADADGKALLVIQEHPTLGIMFTAGAHGRYLIEPGARRVRCAPPAVAAWYWQRMLVGQILPLVAALRGLQVLHASALSVGGEAIAVSGPPGAGKSTLALEFALRGHQVLAEDVLALRLERGQVMAEPGVSLVNLRPSDSAERALSAGRFPVLGRSHKIHVDLPRASSSLPLAALFLLEPSEPGREVLEPLPSPSLPELMGTTFVPYLTRAQDLLRHLELSSALAQTVPVTRVGVDRTMPAATLAGKLERYMEDLRVRREAS